MKLHRPFFVSVEPSAVCQLRCRECPVGMGKTAQREGNARFMSRAVWTRTLGEAAKTAYVMQFYFQGEPLLNKDLPTMIAEAHGAGLYTIVSTNAQAMTEAVAEALVRAGLNRIIVSMDGLSEASYGAYRIGGSLQKCKDALRYLSDAKKRLQSSIIIELQCLRLRTNEHEWETFRKEYRNLGADRLVFKSAQLYDYAEGHPLMPSEMRYSRYRKGTDGRFYRKARMPWCLRVWNGVVITATGEVLPCCYDKAHAYSYGNIMDAPLAQLVRNDKARAFIRAAQKEIPDICKECWR